MRIILALLTIGLSPHIAAKAQDSVAKTVEVGSGVVARVAVFTRLKPDCSFEQPPEVKIVEPPKNGALLVKRVQGKAGAARKCPPDTRFPAEAVLYKSNPGYIGNDSVTLQVKVGDKVTNYVIGLAVRRMAPAKPKDGGREI